MLNTQTMSKIINYMSANDVTTGRTWAQAKVLVANQDLLPTNTELDALNSTSAPSYVTTIVAMNLATKLAGTTRVSYPWYDPRVYPYLTGLK